MEYVIIVNNPPETLEGHKRIGKYTYLKTSTAEPVSTTSAPVIREYDNGDALTDFEVPVEDES